MESDEHPAECHIPSGWGLELINRVDKQIIRYIEDEQYDAALQCTQAMIDAGFSTHYYLLAEVSITAGYCDQAATALDQIQLLRSESEAELGLEPRDESTYPLEDELRLGIEQCRLQKLDK